MFNYHLGQHTAFYVDGGKYIALYNNNFGKSLAVNWIDWNKYSNTQNFYSYYCLYEIDEDNKKYKLVQNIEVPASAFMSGVQHYESNIIISSRTSKYFGEFTKNGDIIKEFTLDRFSYRIRKYNFNEFWFK